MKTTFTDTTTNNVLWATIIEQINDTQTINLVIDNNATKQRTKCEIYTRVMGYFRPVSQFNIWKKSEFYSRTYFEECKSCNSKFIDKYNY